jgi:hypothetical protein
VDDVAVRRRSVVAARDLVALTGIWIVLFQTGLMRGNSVPDFSGYPMQTIISVLVMAALVGAFAEEAGFRGPAIGIAVLAAFAFGRLSHLERKDSRCFQRR